MSKSTTQRHDPEAGVRDRYSHAARARERELCCPVSYDPALLAAIPEEVRERDYGCGDPSAHVRPGETVLDLGSGAGKGCFLSCQVVGPQGRVIGVDFNDEMLAVARRNAPEVARRIGYANVSFRKAKIQDLALDLDRVESYLSDHPVRSGTDLERLEAELSRLREQSPLVADASVDAVVSNCVLNLVRPQDKRKLLGEIRRVLRVGGRAVISDIVADVDVPESLQRDPTLWSGCISGAFREDRLLHAFERAGFHGISILDRQDAPWRTIEGIEFRTMTVIAYKGQPGPCLDRNQAVVYRGPFRQVADDDGHLFRRGERVVVCGNTYRILSAEPYARHFVRIPPEPEADRPVMSPRPDSPCSTDSGCC